MNIFRRLMSFATMLFVLFFITFIIIGVPLVYFIMKAQIL